jgi:hypothetical protein
MTVVSVGESDDLRRILALPRREEYAPPLPLPDLGGELRPIQKFALEELFTYGGAFVSARVGAGKTLISLLAGTVLGIDRVMLLVPAKLKEKTLREARDYQAAGWKVTIPEVVSYELLGRASGADILGTYMPGLLILDEAHKVSNRQAAVTRRVGRFLSTHPSVSVLAMSGTLTRRNLVDFAHIAQWCNHDAAPVPFKWSVLEQWSAALGASTNPWDRPPLGALLGAFGSRSDERASAAHSGSHRPDDGDNPFADLLGSIRTNYAKRIWSTPGCVQTTDGLPGVGLEISKAPFIVPAPALKLIREMQKTWVTPGGDEITSALELHAHTKELGQGFYYQWTEVPPPEWLAARKAWRRYVRGVLAGSRTYDSPLQVENAVISGALVSPDYEPWRRIRDSFKPITQAVWIDDSLMASVASYKYEGPTICWVEHEAVGRALGALSIPFFGAAGICKVGPSAYLGQSIETTTATVVAASISANAEGRNLQRWSRNLVLSPPSMGSIWEQLLGRTHRDGQQADTVDCMVFAPTNHHEKCLTQALAYAKYIYETTGQEQKLMAATWNFVLETEGR